MIRGVNVAGRRPVGMARLRELYASLGLREPRSYLQSGNLVFGCAASSAGALGGRIEKAILGELGLEVSVLVKSAAQMEAVVRGNPLAGRRGVDGQFLHATFLSAKAKAVPLPLGPGELGEFAGDVVYLYCPNGYSNSKMQNAWFERTQGCRATTRNWRTVSALAAMAAEDPAP